MKVSILDINVFQLSQLRGPRVLLGFGHVPSQRRPVHIRDWRD